MITKARGPRAAAFRRRMAVALGLAALLASRPGEAEAAEEPIFLTYEGPATCVTESAVFDSVREKGARVRPAEIGEAARVFNIAIEETSGTSSGRIEVRHLDGTRSERKVTGSSCAEVADALALVLAVTIDPKLEAPPPPRATDVPAATARASEPPRPAAPRETSGRAWRWLGGGFVGLTTGAPRLLVGLGAQVELRVLLEHAPSPAVAVGFERTFGTRVEEPEGEITFSITEGRALLCPVEGRVGVVGFRPCARVDVGQIRADVSSATGGDAQRFWLAFGVAQRVLVSLGEVFEAELQGGVSAPVHRYAFGFSPDVPVEKVAPLTVVATAGLNIAF